MDIFNNLKTYIPSYEVNLPISKKLVSFTPFKVKDAKNLAIILEEKNKKLSLKAMVEVLKNNTVGVHIEDLCLAEAEYLFLKVRSKSIDETITIIYENKKYQINIDDVICKNQASSKVIQINENMSVELKFPTLKNLLELDSFEKDDLYISMIGKVIFKNEVFDTKKYIPDDLKKVLENLPISVLKHFDSYISEQPILTYNLKLESGEIKEVSGTLDFFTYR